MGLYNKMTVAIHQFGGSLYELSKFINGNLKWKDLSDGTKTAYNTIMYRKETAKDLRKKSNAKAKTGKPVQNSKKKNKRRTKPS